MSQNDKTCDGCGKPSESYCCEGCYQIRLDTFSHSTMVCKCFGCQITVRLVTARQARNR